MAPTRIKGYRYLKTFDRKNSGCGQTGEVIAHRLHKTSGCSAEQRVGFYGLDVYSQGTMEVLMSYLSKHRSRLAEYANAIQCFWTFQEDEHRYARARYWHGLHLVRKSSTKLLMEIRDKAPAYEEDPESALMYIAERYLSKYGWH